MTDSASRTGPSREYPRILGSNADQFFVPTVEERRERRDRDETHISLVAAALIFLVVDALWALISVVLLSDFRVSSLAVLAVDVAVVVLTRNSGHQARTAVLIRALLGITFFAVEFALFDASYAYVLGQVLIGTGAVVLSVGRGGEGRNVLGGAFAVIGMVLAMVLMIVQTQGHARGVVEQVVRAEDLARVGRLDDSRAIIDNLLADNPDDADVYLIASDFFAQVAGDIDTALALALKAVEISDGATRVEGLIRVASAYGARQDLPRALQHIEQAIDLDDDVPLLFLIRAFIFLDMGRNQDALADLRRVEEMAPDTDVGQQARIMRLSVEDPGYSTLIPAGL
jgi:tetratricopeptide (TPR) repeat protein